jgi:cellulose synthase/poly-beta-1,6-N-acetylglucosamine synthase-like glycosyltransferase
MPRLSVVIPTVGRPTLPRVLDRLRGAGGDVEVLVVADAAVAKPPPQADLHATEPGAAGARNAGWRAASAPVVLFTDDDVLPAPDLAERHLALHDREPDETAALLGPVRWADELQLTPLMEWLDDGVLFDYGRIDGTEAGWWHFYTANVSVKRALLERAGGFDAERFPYLYEDLDLAYRLSALGLRLHYDPEARAEHLVPPTLAGWRQRMPTLAAAERAFVAAHPEIEPYFQARFTAIAAAPTARGITGRLQPLIPRGAPWLGPRAWVSARERAARELARAFLSAW